MKYTVRIHDTIMSMDIIRHGEQKYLRVNGKSVFLDFSSLKLKGNMLQFSMNGSLRSCKVNTQEGSIAVECHGKSYPVHVKVSTERHSTPDQDSDLFEEAILSPMPGLVSSICTSEGKLVSVDDPVLLLEAMKMENEIRSPVSGRIKSMHVSPGSRVEKGDLLVKIEGCFTS